MPPRTDGLLDDEVWISAAPVTTFTQRDPEEGAPGSEVTEVRIAYDDEAIYVAARLYDRQPITSRLGRRDMALAASDWFRVSIDSFRDRRSAFRFEVNPAGVRRDAIVTGGFSAGGGGGGGGSSFAGSDGDLAWDPVWSVATSADSSGWSAEMRIPFSQLRFTSTGGSWGLQIERIIDRRQELQMFAYSPKSAQGGVSAFGDLVGLGSIRPGRRFELIPYALSQATLAPTPANPFVDDRELGWNAGADARYRMTPNLTLTATVNPDFGQVEVDPAVINLTAFETRLEEKRPFFVEGSSNFKFGGNVFGPGAANLLYSRRIGRAPQLTLPVAGDAPANSRILGAGKITGKTTSGWTLGLLEAVTNRERGRFLDTNGATRRSVVEPMTNYFAGRVNREANAGRSAIGAILTSVNRSLDSTAATVLRASAYSAGIDFSHEFPGRAWFVGGFLAGSRIDGSARSILLTQRSPTRYFQRPDAKSFVIDPDATSMSGLSGAVQIRKQSGRHWTGDSWIALASPGFETNEMGFQQRADRIANGTGLRYTQRQPGSLLRTWELFAAAEHHFNYDGNLVDRTVFLQASAQHLNYWRLAFNGRIYPEHLDDRFTRGGPLTLKPLGATLTATVTSDPRRSVTGSVAVTRDGDRAGSEATSANVMLDLRTSPRWSLSVGPRFGRTHLDAQYVTTVPDPAATRTYGARYLFATLDQTEMSVVTRLNYTVTPNLSLEMYAQPLVANGEYGTPRELAAARSYDFLTYGSGIGTIAGDRGAFLVDPDGTGPLAGFRVPDRSFTTRSLRGNAVLRWEYRPGSTFFLVWQQDRFNPDPIREFEIGDAVQTLFDSPSTNVLVVKWTYWLNP